MFIIRKLLSQRLNGRMAEQVNLTAKKGKVKTLKDFLARYKFGTYMVFSGSHVTVVQNSTIIDNWKLGLNTKVEDAYIIKKVGKSL